MSRYRLTPTPAQEAVMRQHCAHARFVWNLCIEQQSWWWRGRGSPPGRRERQRQLTEARQAFEWLRAGSCNVQQSALLDYTHAMADFFAGVHGKPTWRKEGRRDGFRIVGPSAYVGRKPGRWEKSRVWAVRRLSRRVGELLIPKVGWVRFRWSRPVPDGVKSYRVTLDRAGRWHVGFAAWPAPVTAGPGTGEVVGVDRGITVTAALSTGELLTIPRLSPQRQRRLKRLQRKLSKAKPGSARRGRVKLAAARLHARGRDGRKDWVEKTSTDLARRFDVIRVEDLQINDMTRRPKPRLNPGKGCEYLPNGRRNKKVLTRGILTSNWGMLLQRLEDKAPGRVEKVPAPHTSTTCNACGHCEKGNRKSQAFLCLACGHRDHADVNAAKNIAAGHAVTARGGPQLGPVNREPQIAA